MIKGLACLGFAAAIFAVGCSDGGFKDDGVPKAFTDQAGSANAAAKAADGNFDKLTPDGKAQIMKMANDNEQAARRLTMMMAHPPNEGMKGAHPGPGAGGPGGPGSGGK
jgi:hypothetical protein